MSKSQKDILNLGIWYDIKSEGYLLGELRYDEQYGGALRDEIYSYILAYGDIMTVGALIDIVNAFSFRATGGEVKIKKPSFRAFQWGWLNVRDCVRVLVDEESKIHDLMLKADEPISISGT